jgi:voltage-gated potassium channel
LKERVTQILNPSHTDDPLSRNVNIFIMSLIFLNVLALILETIPELGAKHKPFFTVFEIFSVSLFSIEYILRLWTCDQNSEHNGFKRRLSFALTPMAVIDLLAILPFYLPMLIPYDLRFLRILRLVRVFRLLKLAKYTQSVQLLGKVLVNKKEELVITLAVAIILLVFASSIIYFIENDAQPGSFTSIPAAMWWTVGATTRLGVGPNPSTEVGMILGALIALLGLGLFALPAGILASGLVEEIKNKDTDEKSTCPKCGYVD